MKMINGKLQIESPFCPIPIQEYRQILLPESFIDSPSDSDHGARLRSLLPFFLGKTDFCPDL